MIFKLKAFKSINNIYYVKNQGKKKIDELTEVFFVMQFNLFCKYIQYIFFLKRNRLFKVLKNDVLTSKKKYWLLLSNVDVMFPDQKKHNMNKTGELSEPVNHCYYLYWIHPQYLYLNRVW